MFTKACHCTGLHVCLNRRTCIEHRDTSYCIRRVVTPPHHPVSCLLASALKPQDGTISYEIKLTGELSTNLLSPGEGPQPGHGTLVAPGVNAQVRGARNALCVYVCACVCVCVRVAYAPKP